MQQNVKAELPEVGMHLYHPPTYLNTLQQNAFEITTSIAKQIFLKFESSFTHDNMDCTLVVNILPINRDVIYRSAGPNMLRYIGPTRQTQTD